MPQMELPFDTVRITIITNKQYNRKLRLSEVTVTIYEEDMFAVINVEYCGKWDRGLYSRMRERAREAYRLRHIRPYGEEYWTPDGSVYYLVD